MELLQKIRAGSSLPVIFLTSKDDELDEALGLGMGADDYITKPFSQRLLTPASGLCFAAPARTRWTRRRRISFARATC